MKCFVGMAVTNDKKMDFKDRKLTQELLNKTITI
jgi:hypothetical protein